MPEAEPARFTPSSVLPITHSTITLCPMRSSLPPGPLPARRLIGHRLTGRRVGPKGRKLRHALFNPKSQIQNQKSKNSPLRCPPSPSRLIPHYYFSPTFSSSHVCLQPYALCPMPHALCTLLTFSSSHLLNFFVSRLPIPLI